MELITEVVLDQLDQRCDLVRLHSLVANGAEGIHHVLGPQERQVMPALEFCVEPAWNWQKLLDRAHLRPQAQRRSHQVADDLRVEGVAGHSDSGITEEILRRSASPANTGAD